MSKYSFCRVVSNKDGTNPAYIKGREYYFITFDGLFILKDNGFVARINRKNEASDRQRKAKENTLFFAKILAFGTVGLLIMEVLRYMNEVCCF